MSYINAPRGSTEPPAANIALRFKSPVSTHPLDLDDVLGRECAPVVLVPRQQLVHGRPLAVHQRVHAVLDLPAVLVELQINCD